jgi:hypothetical protein
VIQTGPRDDASVLGAVRECFMVASSRGDPTTHLLIKLDGKGSRALTQQRPRSLMVPRRAVSLPGATTGVSLVPRRAESLPPPMPVPMLTVAGSVAAPALVPVSASIPVPMLTVAGSVAAPALVPVSASIPVSMPPPPGAASAGMAGFVADSMFMYSANDIGHMSTENLGVDAKDDAVFLNEILRDFEPASKQPRLV